MACGHSIDFSRVWSLSQQLKTSLPAVSSIETFRKRNLASILSQPLCRVNVLGDDAQYGHKGCVNTLSWANDGEVLISSGDDKTVRLWRMDNTNTSQEYPFVCRSVIETGHRANVFSAKMLPHSSRIVTAAGDMQIRVFDARTALSGASISDNLETEYSTNESCLRIIQCHDDRAKKIVTEDSPDLFLSLAEDGTVRQHDLRIPHNCHTEACSAPLVDIGFELSTISLSPLTPYQFVVAGDSPHGYLYDRRHLRKAIEAEWGSIPHAGEAATTCVRKFSRPANAGDANPSPAFLRDHITGSRISKINGHEVSSYDLRSRLLTEPRTGPSVYVVHCINGCSTDNSYNGGSAYSGDGVYIFSTKDDPTDDDNMKCKKEPLETYRQQNRTLTDNRKTNSSSPDMDNDDDTSDSSDTNIGRIVRELNPPTALPRQRFTGARNVATIKDVNFLGPWDEWVVSGSDDGNFFIWDKKDALLRGIYEGDSSVVNVVEGHPYLPLLAVSGIDNTVKLFASNTSEKRGSFDRTEDAEQIMDTNRRAAGTRIVRYDLSTLLSEVRAAVGSESDLSEQCIGQ
ncbi:WD40-repeat-containing domain protein [Panaeolus papilionaceus]|nr:WD40-repeat-containing domain protein [Panaeolus papilionaceus]